MPQNDAGGHHILVAMLNFYDADSIIRRVLCTTIVYQHYGDHSTNTSSWPSYS